MTQRRFGMKGSRGPGLDSRSAVARLDAIQKHVHVHGRGMNLKYSRGVRCHAAVATLFIFSACHAVAAALPAQSAVPGWTPAAMARAERVLVDRYGEAQRARVQRGIKQVASMWRAEDGGAAVFEELVSTQFAGDTAAQDALFARFEHMFEKIDGHMQELARELHVPQDLELGPLLPVDEFFAGYDPGAHLTDDFFTNQLAFVALLNFPLTTLEERSAARDWSRRQWAEVRLAQRFARRVPAEVQLAVGEAQARNEQYINGYNIWMNRVLAPGGVRLFPAELRLLSHWNLRDQIRADYAGGVEGALARQQLVQDVMERIVTQTIPARAVDGKDFDWSPAIAATNGEREPDTRYSRILDVAAALRRADAFSPTAPTYIARVFEEREIPEQRVRHMLTEVLESPLVPRVADMIRARLGRELRPFDVWYSGFSSRSTQSAAELDAITARRYPDAAAYQRDIPRMLRKLGFPKQRAEFLARHIVVEPARGSGHAMAAGMRGEQARLRTRIESGGMNYKGYNIAVHEMGHNVEQVFSLEMIDHTLLAGVPANAFTEALAFVFQARDLELLGLPPPAQETRSLEVLNDFWAAYEIAGVALIEIDLWHWLYDHPDATPAQLREAAVSTARAAWNRWYAPVFGTRDSALLGIYSHMVNYPLYLADYPIGRMIAFQIEERVRKSGDLGGEFERMSRIGAVTPDLWMTTAAGAAVGPQALLRATEAALNDLNAKR
jgi:hypothetical protein